MKPDLQRYHRKSTRRPGQSYEQGLFYITICTHQREELFGEIHDGQMHLNDAGLIVEREWLAIPQFRSRVRLDTHVVMPNHFHALLEIAPLDAAHPTPNAVPTVGAHSNAPLPTSNGQHSNAPPPPSSDTVIGRKGPQPLTLGLVIRRFKAAVAWHINELRDGEGNPVWQRSYHDEIVYTESRAAQIRRYIRDNPANWHDDENHPRFAAPSPVGAHSNAPLPSAPTAPKTVASNDA